MITCDPLRLSTRYGDDMTSTTTSPHTQERGLAATVLALTAARLVVNMTRRFGYPFASPIASALNVPLLSVQSVLALQVGIGVSSPLFGALAEQFGRKRVMVAMLVMMSAVGLLAALAPTFGVFAVVMLLFGVGKLTYDPTMLAYIGDRVPYHLRGRAIAFGELGWAGSLLVGAPLVGFLLDIATLQTVFAVFSLLLGAMALLLWLRLPDDHRARGAARADDALTLRQTWALLRGRPLLLLALLYPMLSAVASDLFFINYGVFMEVSFGLQLAALGLVTVVVAAAEVLGELVVMAFSDRMGKRRMSLLSMSVAMLTYPLLPLLDFSLPLALMGVFVMFLFVEIAIVSALPIYTELLPEARSAVMGGVVGMASLGRLLGGALGGLLFALTGDFRFIGVVAGVIALLAVLVVTSFVRENNAP